MRIVFLFCILVKFLFADILLLNVYKEEDFKNKDFTKYLMSEKLDGIRGIWDGKVLKTRQNYVIKVPEFFMKDFPDFALDGELWIKRSDFDSISALVRKDDIKNSLWHSVTYNVFDVPNACEDFKIKNCTLQNRLKILEDYLEKNSNSHIKIITQIPIKNKEHLEEYYNKVLLQGGEGLVIRLNDAPYEKFRTANALKMKPYEDAECQIIAYTKGKGKYENAVGAIVCEANLKQGKTVFKIGSGLKDDFRFNPPPIGTIITYKFSSYTKKGLPRFPVFLRIRE
ncbi:DNA ligase [Campylobacter sp. CCS1377]|uniref:DNA ligase n=1 Tax=Campylobacter sp. CCS1377 TaxID=3158229 RepID=A0AAU7E4U7_9BACT